MRKIIINVDSTRRVGRHPAAATCYTVTQKTAQESYSRRERTGTSRKLESIKWWRGNVEAKPNGNKKPTNIRP